jgi:predicted TIM-barrel fold metal-dependent hydrolase
MNNRLHRREFLAGAVAASCAITQAAKAQREGPADTGGLLDIHVHLLGIGDTDSGCRLSKAIKDGYLFKYLSARLRIHRRAKTLDEGYVIAMVDHVKKSGLNKAVIIGQDAVYDSNGKPNWPKTHFYVPNDYLLQVATRCAETMVPCISINPQRCDTLDELNRCADKGARMLKIHPPIQGVDLADRKHAPFLRRCAELKVVVMVHTGHEHSAPIIDARLANPEKLKLALDEGCTVVACHCGTGWPQDHSDMLPKFLAMVRKYKNLWGDTAVLGSAPRVRDFQRLLADPEARERLLHGSDFAFPATPLAFGRVIGPKKALALQSTENWMERDLALKEELGIGRDSAARAHQLVSRWTRQS